MKYGCKNKSTKLGTKKLGTKVWIILKNYLTEIEGNIVLTPDCVTLREINYRIDCIIRDLEIIREKATKILKY